MKTYYFLILLLFLPCLAFAQSRDHRNRQVDSLEHVLATNPPTGEELMKTYYSLTWGYLYAGREKSMEYAHKCIAVSISIDNWEYMAASFNQLGLLHYMVSQYDSAMYYYDRALETAEKMRDFPKKFSERIIDSEFSRIYGSIGNLYNMQGKYHEAIDYYHKALKIFEKQDWKQSQCEVYHNIGEIYRSMGNFNQAEIIYSKYDTIAHLIGDPFYIAKAKYCFSNLFFNVQDYEKALHNAELAYDYFFSQPDEVWYQMRILTILADIYLTGFNDEVLAEKYARQAIQMNDTLDFPHEKTVALRIASTLHLHRGEWRQAIQTALDALAVDESEPDNTISLYTILAKSYAHIGNAGKVSEYIDKQNELQSTWITKHFQSALSEMEVKYETEKKEYEIERQKNIIARANLYRNVLIGSVAASIGFLALLWYMLRLRSRRNRTLADMNITKDKFFSIISHDLKNPAVAQRDALQMLVNNTRLWDADTLSEFANELLQSAEAHAGLIFNLLGWARLQIGRMTYTPDTFSLSSCFRSEILLIRNMAEKKGISFSCDIPDDISVTGDSNMLSIIIRNLLANAVKFTATGGMVSLKVEPTTAGKYAVSVTDTGTGMTCEQKQKLFRLDSTQSCTGTAGEQGSGLGLIVCKELLEKHGTTLHVESEEGKGSRFWFEV